MDTKEVDRSEDVCEDVGLCCVVLCWLECPCAWLQPKGGHARLT